MVRPRSFSICVSAMCLVLGCTPSATTDKPAQAIEPPRPHAASAVAKSSATPAASSAGPTSVPAGPAAAGKIAKDTLPDGLNPINDAEAQEADTQCKALGEALKAAAKQDKEASKSPVEFSLKFLAHPPRLKGTDSDKCANLMSRDLLVYRAKTIESMAIQHLKVIALSANSAYERDPHQMCPKAGPTPSDLSLVQDKVYHPKTEDWETEGWKCLRFNPMPAVRYQYEVRTDPKSLTYEAIARGYPVKGGPVSELYLRGKVAPEASEPPGDVLRR